MATPRDHDAVHSGHSSMPRGIVVTGATGFVGGELLKRLLRRDDGRTIVCPVRAESDDAAEVRGSTTLSRLLGRDPRPYEADRVEWIRGDLEEVRLGWSNDTWIRVARQTNEVFHCAAVSLDAPLDEAHRVNVTGTVHGHQLALTAHNLHRRFRRFHHLSSAYVAGRTTARVHASYLPNDRAHHYRNAHERTKARAERYLRASAVASERNRVPISIYRPSIVAGDTHGGRTTSWNALYEPMKMAALGRLPHFPHGGRALVDAVGVDVVVDAMLALGETAHCDLHAYHLTAGPSAFTIRELLDRTIRRALEYEDFEPSPTVLLNIAKWTAMAAAAKVSARAPKTFGRGRTHAPAGVQRFARWSSHLPYTMVNTIFDNSREQALLRRFGIHQPDGSDYLESIIGYALDTRFGAIAPPVIEPVARPAIEPSTGYVRRNADNRASVLELLADP
ncbi:MAG: NAD-dependent epimerase/dehydratase family protein [Acidimicrobiales bacterium]|nr:NAD-dependent epimerase/dehydratase family protein [Acidimicrobiales bacterium]